MFEVDTDLLYQYNIRNITNFQICREPFMTVPIVIYAKKNFYLIQAMNDKIESLKGAGLIEYWYSQQFLEEMSKEEKSPEVLTLAHLSGCFQILAGGCVFSFVAFVAEWMHYKWKTRFRYFE